MHYLYNFVFYWDALVTSTKNLENAIIPEEKSKKIASSKN